MQLFETVRDMQLQSMSWRAAGWRIAFVPTMGNLHQGHLDLVREAVRCADKVVVSIFVNPLQFDEADDYRQYPRTLEQDRRQLESLGIAAVFAPAEQEMYPAGRDQTTRVEVPGISAGLEGACRPGHFAGVATVVTKLFQAVLPDIALFGEKDFQQLLVVRKLVADLNLPVTVAGLPTRRESDGLAMSSRNSRLSQAERQQAAQLYTVLSWTAEQLRQGRSDFLQLEKDARQRLEAAGFSPDYVSIRDARSLEPVSPDSEERIVLAAARLGQTRLIDNLRV
jgi:pantoate--beta-alanine ligase